MHCNIANSKEQHTTIFHSSSNLANQVAMYSTEQCLSNFVNQLTICMVLVSGHLILPVS